MHQRRTRPDRRSPARTGLAAWFATHGSISILVVIVLGALASTLGFVVALGDPDGENLLSFLMILGPTAAGAFPTLELAWDRRHDLSMPRMTARWFVFPTLAGIGGVVAMGITEVILRATGAMAAAQAADPWHYWFPSDGPPVHALGFALLGFVAGLLLSLALFVLILWPMQIILRPRKAIAEAQMDTDPRHARRNRAALALLPLIVVDAFVIGTALTLGITWLAVVSILAEIAMTIAAVRLQRLVSDRIPGAQKRVGFQRVRPDQLRDATGGTEDGTDGAGDGARHR